jgi:hypothetical protein
VPVRRKPNIKFETIATGSQRNIERSQRIFWSRLPATRTTVTKKQRTIFHKGR